MNPEAIFSSVIKQKIEQHIPDADVVVEDMTGTGANFAVDVIAPSFEGLTLLAQHRQIYNALGDEMRERIHALKIKTSAK